jgi:hypothetical protein
MGFFPASTLLGLVLMVASASLFVVRKVKPNLYEESDNIYAAVAFICALFLLASTDLSAAMAMQQFLLIPATITLMWQFISLRAENKQLKNRQSGTESPKAYNARLDDELETPRERRQGKRRRNVGYEDEERRLLGDRQDSALEYTVPDRRSRSFDAEDNGDRYGNRQESTSSRRRSDWEDEADWDERPAPRTARRALPDADSLDSRAERRARRSEGVSDEAREPRESSRRRDDRFDSEEPDVTPRRRVRPQRDRDNFADRSVGAASPLDNRSRDSEGTMSSYVDYEPIVDPKEKPSEPPSGLPPSGSEPIVFPDRY